MSMIAIALLGLFILCNGLWLSAIIAAARADRYRLDTTTLGELSAASSEKSENAPLCQADSITQ